MTKQIYLIFLILLLGLSACASTGQKDYRDPNMASLLSGEKLSDVEREKLTLATIQRVEFALEKGKNKSALKYAKLAIRFDPEDVLANYALGQAELANQNYTKSSEIFESLKDQIDTADIFQYVGVSAYHLNQKQKAKIELETALSRDPSLWRAATILARIENSESRYEAADQYFDNAVEQSLSSAFVHDHRGHAFVERKDWARAVAAFEEAQSTSNKSYGYHDDYRFALAKSGKISLVLNESTSDEVSRLYRGLGEDALQSGRKLDAIDYLKKAQAYSSRYDDKVDKLLKSALLLGN